MAENDENSEVVCPGAGKAPLTKASVRREIRSLSEASRIRLFNAMNVMQNSNIDTGQCLYG